MRNICVNSKVTLYTKRKKNMYMYYKIEKKSIFLLYKIQYLLLVKNTYRTKITECNIYYLKKY